MTPAEHRAEAERLLRKARGWERSAAQPDAAGSAIRAVWSRQAAIWRQEALVHAQLGTAPEPTVSGNATVDVCTSCKKRRLLPDEDMDATEPNGSSS